MEGWRDVLQGFQRRLNEDGGYLREWLEPSTVDQYGLTPGSRRESQWIESELKRILKLARSYRDDDDVEGARRLYEDALKMAPTRCDVMREFAEAMEQSDKVVVAEGLYQQLQQPFNDPGSAQDAKRRVALLPAVNAMDNKELLRAHFLLDRFHATLPLVSTPGIKERYLNEIGWLTKHIYNTVAIEGNLLTEEEVRRTIESEISPGGHRTRDPSPAHDEIRGMREAFQLVTTMNFELENLTLEVELTLGFSYMHKCTKSLLKKILAIHRRVLKGARPEKRPGNLRDINVYVKGAEFIPVHHQHVESEMGRFLDWINRERKLLRIHPFELAALAHYKLVHVHPFVDGNGRTARVIAAIILLQFNIPPVVIHVTRRDEYMKSIDAANQGNMRVHTRFIVDEIRRTLEEAMTKDL